MTYVKKDKVYLYNTPAEGYRFVCYRVTDASGNAISVLTPINLLTGEISAYYFDKQTATVTAEFEKLPEAHAVNVNQPTGGSVSVSKDTASEGDRVDLSGQAESGYLFRCFVVTKVSDGSSVAVEDANGFSTQHSWYFTMPDEAVNVTAEFKAAHSITANPQNGTIEVDSLAVPGDTVTFRVSADNGYEIKNIQVYKTGDTNVSVTKVGLGAVYRFTMPDYPVTISAETELRSCSIQWNTTHCTVDGPTQGRAGDEVTFTVTPEEGYRVRTISVNDDTRYGIDRTDVNGSTYTYQMTLKAINTGTYTVDVVCDNGNEAGFEISREFGLGSASITNASGEEITRAEGGEQIRIRLLNGDGVDYSPGCFIPKDASSATGERNLTGDNTFVMPFCDMKVVLVCTAKIFHLTIADGMEHGNVSSTKVGEVLFNSTVFFTITPERGYKLEKLLMGDVDVTGQVSENTYDCSMPAHDVTVTATFKPIFATPDFTMPAALRSIEESAFEGMTLMHVVDAGSVSSVGKWAFKDTGLTQIKLPQNCFIDADAFTGCGTVYVFAPAGGTTESWCRSRTGIVFVAE